MQETRLPTKVIIVEDHLLFADGLEQILTSLPGFEVIDKLNNGKRLMQALNSKSPDLLLLDINMPYMDGMEAAANVRKNHPSIKIIFLSMYFDRKMITTARQLGANGFVTKTVMAPVLKDVLIRVMAGENVFILPERTQLPQPAGDSDAFARQYKLSTRELEIIGLIKEGKSTKAISDQLFLSVYTIETHRKNIFRKLQVKNVMELIAVMDRREA
jgi:DNA-binding NarL/FixJ family response regulator